MHFLPLLEAKRDGKTLTPAQVQAIVTACTAGKIPDYQLAAFLMAVFFRGLTPDETRALTLAMRESGKQLSFPSDPRPLVDKHSTGGVGDKVSLVLAPLLACLGFRVPMISGRGLGITGGTLDKLDSIPGFKTSLPIKQLTRIVQEVGCVICGQTEEMVPADKILYALRDVTGTVPSIPLIVASILSKKLAENLNSLVLDVKFGAAAFMPTARKARELAQAMVELGNSCGMNTRALLTRMDVPIGRAVGNWLEVKEAVALLDCGAEKEPGAWPDLRELVLASAAQLLVQAGKAGSLAIGRRQAEHSLATGAAREKFRQMLVAQGADLEAFDRKLARNHTARVVRELPAPQAGFVVRCDACVIGEVVRDLGGGRRAKASPINYDVGVDRLAKPGNRVAAGEALARVHAASARDAGMAQSRLMSAFELSREQRTHARLITEVIGA